jgi:hypothetical protein
MPNFARGLAATLIVLAAGWWWVRHLAIRASEPEASSSAQLALAPEPAALPAALPAQVPTTDGDLEQQLKALESLGYSGGTQVQLDETGVTVHEVGRATPGANLYCSGHGPDALLVDNFGRELHRWRKPFPEVFPEAGGWDEIPFRRVLLLPEGRLLAIYEGRGLVALDSDSRVLWRYAEAAHHDVRVAPDGRIFVLIRVAHVVPNYHPERPILEDFVATLDASGTELARVSILECLRAGGRVHDSMRAFGDILHTNTLALLDGRHAHLSDAFRAGNVLVSVRNTDQLVVLDLETKRAVWALRGAWRRQHEPSLLDDGRILLFNNRARKDRSSVLEVDALSGESVWEVHSSDELVFGSKACGSARRLSTGNTLIVGSESARALEITPGGELVWEFRNPHVWPDDPTLAAVLYDLMRIEQRELLSWLR